jgi:hypothetical protein
MMWVIYVMCGLAVAEAMHNAGYTRGAIRYWVYFCACLFWPVFLVYAIAYKLFATAPRP